MTETATKLKFKPYADRVLIKVDDEIKVSDGGIALPDTATKKLNQGVVVAVGDGRRAPDGTLIPMDSKVGQKLLFSKYSGSEIEIDKETYLVLTEKDILGRLG